MSCELLVSRLRHAKAGPLGAGNAARRRVRRIVGVGMGLPRHDGEVEGRVGWAGEHMAKAAIKDFG